MFANFASRRHFNGPLRAVSPVEHDYVDVDWKLASKQARKHSDPISTPSHNSQKLIEYINRSFIGCAPKSHVSIKESLALFAIEAISLFIPLFYILSVLSLLVFAAYFFSGPMIEYFLLNDYLHTTYWACPAVLSVGLLYVLLRPIFGGFRSYHGRVLLRQEAPALFSLVENLSRYLDVATPKRIEINNETAIRVDAYAGINSIYRDEYKLIIGAPLLMSLSLNELSALIAHELAHFQSKQKKIAFYLIHHVSEWLYYRATGHDKRYQALLKKIQKEKLPLYEFYELWFWQRLHLGQQYLFMCLFRWHRYLTAWKCRQIEFETDAVARTVSGSDAFKVMFKGLRATQFAQNEVSLQNDWAWKDGYLLDDYALAVALEAKKVLQGSHDKIEEAYHKTISYFCPNDAERIHKAQDCSLKGVFNANVASKFLLEDASRLSKDLTLLDYEANGIVDANKFCVPSQKIRKLKHLRAVSLKNASLYFNNRSDGRILKFEPSSVGDVLQLSVVESIDQIRSGIPDERKLRFSALDLSRRIRKSYVIERLRASKLPVDKYIEGIPSKKEATGYLQYMQEQYVNVIKKIECVDQVYYQRAHEAMNVLDAYTRSKVHQSFQNLELYCQVRSVYSQLLLSYKPLNLIANGLRVGVNIRTLRAGVAEKRLTWDQLQLFRAELENRPIKVSLHGRFVHIITYIDDKLGSLPQRSESLSVMAMAEYLHHLIQLLEFQYNKWQGQLASTLIEFERKNGISQVI